MALAVRGLVPEGARPTPIVLVHGAANSSPQWHYWQPALAEAGWASYALDLRGHGGSVPADLGNAGMEEYVDDVGAVASTLATPPIVMGWSMGGLVALRFAEREESVACVALAPSPPARERDPAKPIRTGVFDASEYGITSSDPDEQRTMPDLDREERLVALGGLSAESWRAKTEREAGVVVTALRSPLLLVAGARDRQFPPERYEDLWLPHERVTIPEASHWGLVLSRPAVEYAVPHVLEWLEARTSATRARRRSSRKSPVDYCCDNSQRRGANPQ